MSPQASKLRDHVLNALIGLLATLFILFGTGAWSRKENASDHLLDMQRLDTKVERVLDVLCEEKPRARACIEHPSSINGDVVPRDR